MPIRQDWHVHTRNSHCGKSEAEMTRMIERARGLGLERIGITDHLNNPPGLWEVEGSRKEFDERERPPGVFFAVEVTTQRERDVRESEEAAARGETYRGWREGPPEKPIVWLPDDVREKFRFRYVLGAAHWSLGAPPRRMAMVRSYHEQNMVLAEDPRIDVVGHPWWFTGGDLWKDVDGTYKGLPWFDDFRVVPQSMHDEFAAAARENGKAVEINANAIMLRPAHPPRFREQYREYLALLRERGVVFSLGSDAHHPDKLDGILALQDDLDAIGIKEDELWQGPASG